MVAGDNRVSDVPEPATIPLAEAGLAAAVLWRRSRI